MVSRQEVYQQIKGVTIQLIEFGLCDEQSFPSMRQNPDGSWEISVREAGPLSIALKNVSYGEIYAALNEARTFNVKMLDGALVQMLYRFDGDGIVAHRLAFFPSPELEDFQNDPDIYLHDELYADILSKNIVPFPIRFDFNRSYDQETEAEHPKSHLTLGQYQNCRIPVSAPLTPFVFADFILRNFYNTAFCIFTDKLILEGEHFAEVIAERECSIVHVKLRDVSRNAG